MSKMSFNRLIPLLRQPEQSDGVMGLLRETIVLQAKIENLGEEDFYFQKGMVNHIAHLESMKKQYAQIVETVNSNNVEYFIEEIKEQEAMFQKICSRESNHPVFAKVMVDAQTKSQISHLQNLLHIKGRFGTLKPLDELMKDEELLMSIFAV